MRTCLTCRVFQSRSCCGVLANCKSCLFAFVPPDIHFHNRAFPKTHNSGPRLVLKPPHHPPKRPPRLRLQPPQRHPPRPAKPTTPLIFSTSQQQPIKVEDALVVEPAALLPLREPPPAWKLAKGKILTSCATIPPSNTCGSLFSSNRPCSRTSCSRSAPRIRSLRS